MVWPKIAINSYLTCQLTQGIVFDALKYVAQKKEELSTLLNNSDIEEGAKEIQITTNQVF